MCWCECPLLSCLSILLITLNPREDTLNPLCQSRSLQQHSSKELGLALAHSLHQKCTYSLTHTHTHTHTQTHSLTHICQVTPKQVTKRRKHFCLGRKENNYPTSVYVCENMSKKGKREWEQQKEKEGNTHTQTYTHIHFRYKDRGNQATHPMFGNSKLPQSDDREWLKGGLHWSLNSNTVWKPQKYLWLFIILWTPPFFFQPLPFSLPLPLIYSHFSLHQKGIREMSTKHLSPVVNTFSALPW